MAPSELLLRIAGTGKTGLSGDGGPAADATFTSPFGMAFDPSGNLYVADINNAAIRRITPEGIISTVAGTGVAGMSGDGGPAIEARFSLRAYNLAVDSQGSLYIADASNHRVRKVDRDGIVTTVAGTGTAGYSGDGGAATEARLNTPTGVAVSPSGNLYIADLNNHRVRRVAQDGIIDTVVGTGARGFDGDGGPASAALLNLPWHVAVGADGALYIADNGNHRIRRVDPAGAISTVAGNGNPGYAGDGGAAVDAQLQGPIGVAVAPDGSLYIVDGSNNVVRRVGTDGVIRTVVGK